ncbi:MAG: ExbD/TolR family protein [Acidobacteriota bacterium]
MAFTPQDPDAEDALLGEINVTPLVDVMLVLLIIFMIAAPMLHQGIEVALPQATAEPLPMRTDDPLVLSIDAGGLIFIEDDPVDDSLLVDKLQALIAARGDDTVFLKGDREVPYGRVVQVLDMLYQNDITRVGMVTEAAEGNSGRR